MKLAQKFSITLISIGFSILLASSFLIFNITESSLKQSAFERITSIRDSKKREIQSYFISAEKQILSFSSNLMTIAAAGEFTEAFQHLNTGTLQGDEIKVLDDYYDKHFFPEYLKADMSRPTDSIRPQTAVSVRLQNNYLVGRLGDNVDHEYSQVHHRYHSLLKQFQERHGFYDIFLIDVAGNVVYTALKEIDFATNLNTGPHRFSGLASIYQRAIELGSSGETTLQDFAPYTPSFGKPAAFIATQLHEHGKLIGIAVFQLPIDQINNIMTSEQNWFAEGYGKTGESYILAGDYSMRNDSRFLITEPDIFLDQLANTEIDKNALHKIQNYQTTISFQKVRSLAAQEAISGKQGTQIVNDYRSTPVLSSYTPLQLPGLHWVLLAEIDVSEVFQPIAMIKQYLIVLSLVIGITLIVVAIRLAKQLTTPLQELEAMAKGISEGIYAKKVQPRQRDEVGTLTVAFNKMIDDLQASTTQLKNIVETAPDGIVVITESGVIREFSPSAEQIFGLKKSQVLGADLCQWLLEPDSQQPVKHFKAYLDSVHKKHADASIELIAIQRSGQKVPIELAVSAMSVAEEPLMTVLVRDITLRRKAEKAILESMQAIEASNQIKSQLLSNMSHEIRTPMNAIVGMTSFLSDSDLSNEQRHYVDTLDDAIKSLMRIINDILDFSHLETDELSLNPHRFNLEQITQPFFNEVGRKAEKKGLQLEIEIESGVPQTYVGDDKRILQVLLNLGDNAVKFTPTGGRVELAISSQNKDIDHVLIRFTVKDNGIGIAEEDSELLYKAFTQFDGSSTRSHGGLGLGLSISHKLTELLGGRLWHEPSNDIGSLFHLELLLEKGPDTAVSAKQELTTVHDKTVTTAEHELSQHTPKHALELLKELQVKLREGDTSATDTLEKLITAFTQNIHSDEVNGIAKATADYDFERAESMLEELYKKLT